MNYKWEVETNPFLSKLLSVMVFYHNDRNPKTEIGSRLRDSVVTDPIACFRENWGSIWDLDQKSGFEPLDLSGLFSGGLEDKNVERNEDDGGPPCALSERRSEEALKNSIGTIQHFEPVAVWSAGTEVSCD